MARPRKTLNEILRGRALDGAADFARTVTPPKRPTGLSRAEAAVWDSITKKLVGIVDAVDALALAALARWSAEHDRIVKALTKATPGTKEHTQLVAAAAKAWTPLAGLLTRFGLDPVSREKIAMPPAPPQVDPRAEKFFGRGATRPPTKYDRMGMPHRFTRPADIDDALPKPNPEGSSTP